MGCNSVTALFFVALSLARCGDIPLIGVSAKRPLIRPECFHAAETQMKGGKTDKCKRKQCAEYKN